MSSTGRDHIVYTSAFLYEIDAVRIAFRDSGVPFHVQTESLAGVRSALAALPVQGFGTRWYVIVPENALLQAKEIIASMHLTTHSDTTPFPAVSPEELKKNFWKALLIVSPVILLFAYILYKALMQQ